MSGVQDVFCQIREKEPEKIIFEDDHTFVILDIRPVSEGHLLVIPKKHTSSIDECTTSDLEVLFNTVTYMRDVLMKTFGYDGVDVSFQTGNDILEVPHFHIHLVGGFRNVKNEPYYKKITDTETYLIDTRKRLKHCLEN